MVLVSSEHSTKGIDHQTGGGNLKTTLRGGSGPGTWVMLGASNLALAAIFLLF